MVLASIFNYYCTVLAPALNRRWPKRFSKPGAVTYLPGLVLKRVLIDYAPAEAATLRYIRQHTTIPVPKVYASTKGHKFTYLLMERIEGDCLLLAWDKMDEQQRDALVAELKGYIAQLRALPSPYGRAVCAVDGGSLRDTRITSTQRIGPFPDEASFNEFVVDWAEPFMDPYELGKIRPQLKNDHSIYFTHGDLAPRNIMAKDGRISGVVDWGESGWYPQHWECVKAMWFPELGESWVRRVRAIFDEEDTKDWLVDREMSKHFVGAF